MKIYNFDSNTMEFLSSETCDLDPIEGLPMIPAFATDIKPMAKPGKNKVRIFEDNKWIVISDYRGQVFDIHTHDMREYNILGELPENVTNLTPKPNSVFESGKWITKLSIAAKNKKDELLMIFQRQLSNKFISTINIPTKITLFDIQGVSVLLDLNKTEYKFVDCDYVIHTLTPNELLSLYDEMIFIYDTYYMKLIGLLEEVDAASTNTKIATILWN